MAADMQQKESRRETYSVSEPSIPNWSLEETPLGNDVYFLSMRARVFRSGGDGESLMLLKRRAAALQREKGFSGYQVVDYAERVESGWFFSQKVAEGTIQLVGKPNPFSQFGM
ncbi:hypothetical protein [Propionivibrio limicola]|uniref:hypothetical protein n=1 Tax=Propionivibrio limicola TaxID=167645 RepID=UPI001290C009|nr:hypothetical protein [Propionivibrio limicola]